MLPVCRRKYDIFPASGKFNPHLRKAPQNGKLTPSPATALPGPAVSLCIKISTKSLADARPTARRLHWPPRPPRPVLQGDVDDDGDVSLHESQIITTADSMKERSEGTKINKNGRNHRLYRWWGKARVGCLSALL